MWNAASGASRQTLQGSLTAALLLVATPATAQIIKPGEAVKPAPAAEAAAPKLPVPKDWPAERICALIDKASRDHGLPRATFARLIWTESRFDVLAVSPVGAMGIAQFMPGTAMDRKLANPFAPDQAIDASASLLKDLRARFGNFGLAAAAYNAGAGRVNRWLTGKSKSLPFETRDYVAAITGNQADYFRKDDARLTDFALKKGTPFAKACAALPVLRTRAPGVPQVPGVALQTTNLPWGVQVAGNFSRTKAMRNWERVRARLGVGLGDAKPSLHRERTRRGMKSKWAVRLGTSSRVGAQRLCKRIQRAGGFCLVKRNR